MNKLNDADGWRRLYPHLAASEGLDEVIASVAGSLGGGGAVGDVGSDTWHSRRRGCVRGWGGVGGEKTHECAQARSRKTPPKRSPRRHPRQDSRACELTRGDGGDVIARELGDAGVELEEEGEGLREKVGFSSEQT